MEKQISVETRCNKVVLVQDYDVVVTEHVFSSIEGYSYQPHSDLRWKLHAIRISR